MFVASRTGTGSAAHGRQRTSDQRNRTADRGLPAPTVAYHVERLERPGSSAAEPRRARRRTARGKVRTRERVAEMLACRSARTQTLRGGSGSTKSTVAYHARRLGAPVDERCARRYDWAAIQRFYDEGHTVSECRLRFGFSSETWNAAVRRGAVTGRPNKLPLDELLVANTFRSRHNLRLRLVREGVKKAECERCGLTKWHGAPVPLALHHINGDRTGQSAVQPGALVHELSRPDGELRRAWGWEATAVGGGGSAGTRRTRAALAL